MAGISETEKRDILTNFPFAEGDLPVRFLGLPLMSQSMRKQDNLPLLEKTRNRISSWMCRFLSYAGRLQLIKDMLMRIVNFLAAVFCLPSNCIKEVEQLCFAFLWIGPVLKYTNAKVAWKDVCLIKNEGGLGLRDLKEVKRVYGLKLIWRMLSGVSLWGKWIRNNLLKGKSFWEVNSKLKWGLGCGESLFTEKSFYRSGKVFLQKRIGEWKAYIVLV